MPKQKRKDIAKERPAPRIATATPLPERVLAPVKTMRSVYCFGCGSLHGIRVTGWEPSYEGGPGHFPTDRENFWQRLAEADYSEQPFGIIQEVGLGQGKSFKVVGYFNPDDDPDGFYPLVKQRFLNAISEWVHKGWVTPQEVLAEIPAKPAPTPQPPAEAAPPVAAKPTATRKEVISGPGPARMLHDKWTQAKAKRVEGLQHEIDALEKANPELDMSEVQDALDDYRGIERSDYESQDEFKEARDEQWDAVLESLESVADTEEETP